ncbi:HD domain-containing phosphohydrolase [Solibacillus cecembensis]|uniref:HD-GYP domain-containing protein n=1 Tax=Solibacillus cecembensis TaxID=459347 RepID=UPI000716F5D7
MTNRTIQPQIQYCTIEFLKPGDVVNEDLYVENRRLLSKGHVLTERIITLLKNRNVTKVCIQKTETDNSELIMEMDVKADGKVESELNFTKPLFGQIQTELGYDYLHVLGSLSSEKRYGRILNNSLDIQFLKNLFIDYMQNPVLFKYIENLKSHDEYTYMHSIDVFTISTLFALSEGIPNIQETALGYLFHDIGKLMVQERVLMKQKNLLDIEYNTIQRHTLDGFNILTDIGFENIAYLAKSHHERLDGSGYPEGLAAHQQSIELQILQITDVYSAMTTNRPYKEAASANITMTQLLKQSAQFDSDLVHRFIDFIGIYPENAVVLLSDSNQAIVEKVNPLYPLLPEIKLVNTGHNMTLPIDLSITIQKFLTLTIETPANLFVKFSDYLILNDEFQIDYYYNRLKEHFDQSEWFTQIYIPVFQIINVIENYQMIPTTRSEAIKLKFLSLIKQSLTHYRHLDAKKKKVIILTDDIDMSIPTRIFEGLLHNYDFYPFPSDLAQSNVQIENLIAQCHAEIVISIGQQLNVRLPITLDHYHLTEQQLETVLSRYNGTKIHNQSLSNELKKFISDTQLISSI